jgi:hypothetical protein
MPGPEQPAAPDTAPRFLVSTDDVGRAIAARLPLSEFLMTYREIVGLEGQFQWHIGDSQWWVRLHGVPAEYFDMAKLDTSKTYRVAGNVLEQNYGVVEVWVHRIGPTN